jgi:hypothetical protein
MHRRKYTLHKSTRYISLDSSALPADKIRAYLIFKWYHVLHIGTTPTPSPGRFRLGPNSKPEAHLTEEADDKLFPAGQEVSLSHEWKDIRADSLHTGSRVAMEEARASHRGVDKMLICRD